MKCDINNKLVTRKLDKVAFDVVKYLVESGSKISTAESLTGGLVSKCITDVAGSSAVFELGICSYSNRIKTKVLGVDPDVIDKYTEVSSQTAVQMCKGVLSLSDSDFAVSTTGIAGPTGGSKEKPVGTVYVCVMNKSGEYICRNLELNLEKDCITREDFRVHTVLRAFLMLEELFERGEQ